MPAREQPTALTRPISPKALGAARSRQRRTPWIIAALIVLFGAGAFLAWAASRSHPAAGIPDASARVDAPAPPADAAPLLVDASIASAPSVPDAGGTTIEVPPKPRLTARQRHARELMRRWRATSSPLRKMALAQQAFEADPAYNEARFAFADALLGTDVAKNRTRACRLLSRFPSRSRRAGCAE